MLHFKCSFGKIKEDSILSKIKRLNRLPLTSDYVFKRVFAKEGNEDILKDFLESILDIKIQKVEVKNPELPKEASDMKGCILDIKAQIDDKIVTDIEMQIENAYNISDRSTYYVSRLLGEQIKVGEEYRKVKKSIVICLLKFSYYKRNSYHQIARMKFEKTKEREYVELGYDKEDEIATEDIEMHFIELPKFKKKNPEISSKLEQWLWVLLGEEEKIKMAERKNKEIKKAIKELDEISMTDSEREMYESRLKWEYTYKSGIAGAREAGIKEGIRQKAEDVAKQMLKKNIDINTIIACTDLTEEEIKKLK